MLYLFLVKEDYSIYFKKRSAMQGVFLLTTQHKRKTMVEHIQIKGVIPRIQYIADGTTTEFEFPFAIFKSDNLTVYLNDILQDTSTYQVNGAEDTDGGSIVFTVPPSVSTQVTLCRNLKVERLSDFQEGVTLRANVLNDELDYQTACIQELAENINRSMVLPPYATNTNVDLTLPFPQAGKAIVWNTEGTNLENSTVAINDLERTLYNYKETAIKNADITTNNVKTATDLASQCHLSAQTAQTAFQNAQNLVEKFDEQSDYIIENYADGNTWYKIYKSGFKEQGGIVQTNGSELTVTFLKAFSSIPNVFCIPISGDTNPFFHNETIYDISTTSFKTFWGNNTNFKSWIAFGK